MRVNATWLHSSLRTFVLGAFLAAAWIILGAASAHASEPLRPLTDAVPKITGNETAPGETSLGQGTQTSGVAAEETMPAGGPVAAFLEPAATIAEPLASPVHQIVDPALVPVDAALAPAAAPVTSVINHAAQVAGPLTGIAAETLTPVTSMVAAITAPVTGTLADVVASATGAVGSTISNPVVAPIGDKTTAALPAPTAVAEAPKATSNATRNGGAATEPPVISGSPSSAIDADNMRRPLPDQSVFALTVARAGSPEMQTQNPAPGLPNAPGRGSPATAPTGPGSSVRAASDTGSVFADRLAGFELSTNHSSLSELFRRSDDLPGSVSLEQGFSPD